MLPLVNVTPEAVLYYQVPMMLAVAGGIWAFAPRQYFPFAAQVHGTFQSFKILPTVLTTMAKPFGHVFKVTPKGASAKKSDFDRTIFWTAGSLIVLTILGLVINVVPEWRIIGQPGLLPVLACLGRNQHCGAFPRLHDVAAGSGTSRRRAVQSRRTGLDLRRQRCPFDWPN